MDDQQALPRCYRHPDQDTGIRCSRCGRPICPQCMISASVGFQCPACVNDGNRAVRAVHTGFGGRPVTDYALVTKVLIAINVIVFLIGKVAGEGFIDRLILVGSGYSRHLGWVGVAKSPDQWYRLLTAVFLHEQWAHIGLNMLALWWIGPHVERALGRRRYIALYLLSGLGGSALSLLLAPADQGSLGASGAIFGLLGALLVLFRRLGLDLRPVAIIIAINLFITFAWPNIDWRAHLGGLVSGFLIALGMVYAPRDRRTLVQVATCAGVFLVELLLIILGVAQING